MLTFPLIQVAGVIDETEARMLVAAGVHYLGFPLRLSVHREDLPENDAGRIMSSLRPPHRGVLITYLDDAAQIDAFARSLGARIVQLHGDIDPGELRALKRLDPGLAIIKSLVVRQNNEDDLARTADVLGPLVDAFITDTFDPATGASGATGKAHDWSVSRRLVERATRPVILAGGLTPDNVEAAIHETKPAGVDAHTGVEGPDGRKSRAKVEAFVERAAVAFQRVAAETDNGH